MWLLQALRRRGARRREKAIRSEVRGTKDEVRTKIRKRPLIAEVAEESRGDRGEKQFENCGKFPTSAEGGLQEFSGGQVFEGAAHAFEEGYVLVGVADALLSADEFV
jgi:hypothetical protein